MGRAPCCEKVGLNRGAWTREEDLKLMQYIAAHGEGSWRTLPKAAGLLRCGKSCRLRWINYLRPDLKRGNITEEEDKLIIKLHSVLGNRWSLIAGRLSGRTDNEIKNYWNTHLKKKLKSMGIDPNTHQPLTLSININQSNSLHNNQKQSQNSNTDNKNNLLMPGNGMRYLAYGGKNKGGMPSKTNVNKYEIDRYLSSATASAANASVIRSANHFDYKAKPMFSLDFNTASVLSDDSSARAAFMNASTGSHIRACAPPPLPLRCNSASSSSSSAPSPPSKNPSVEYNSQAAFPPPPQYPFSKDLAALITKNPSSIQAFTPCPSSIQAPTKNPSPIQAFIENPSSFHGDTKNPSPIQAFTEHPALIQAHTKKAIQAFIENPSPNEAHIQNPSPLQAYPRNPSQNPTSDEAFTKNPTLDPAHTKNPFAGEAFTKNPSADQAYTKSALMNGNVNACSTSTSATSSYASVGYSCEYNNNPTLAYNNPLKPISLEISDESLMDIKENEGADTSVLSMLETDFMWDFEMGCMQPSGMEEEAHLPTPTQELLQTLWGPSNSIWLSEQQDQKFA